MKKQPARLAQFFSVSDATYIIIATTLCGHTAYRNVLYTSVLLLRSGINYRPPFTFVRSYIARSTSMIVLPKCRPITVYIEGGKIALFWSRGRRTKDTFIYTRERTDKTEQCNKDEAIKEQCNKDKASKYQAGLTTKT